MLKHIQEKLKFVIYKIKQTTIERSPQAECVVLKTPLFTHKPTQLCQSKASSNKMLKHIQEKLRFVIYKIKQTTIERSPQAECVVK